MPQLQPRIAIVQLSGVQWGTWIITDECLSVVIYFFSSSLADVALRLGPYMSISCRKDVCTRTPLVHMSRQIEVKTTNKNTQTTKPRRPANPPARLAFRQRKQQNKQQQTRHKKNGAGAQTKHPQNRFAKGHSGLTTASLSKTCEKMN